MIIYQDILNALVEKKALREEEAYAVMKFIMEGKAASSQIAAFLIGLAVKGETVEEITGCAKAMREAAVKIKLDRDPILDTCGTGGDAKDTFNISTVTALVIAGAGVTVAKHGNRSVSSRCGSADILERLGVKIEVGPEMVEKCLKEVGLGFLFAPLFHPAMKYAMPTRKELGVRTIFNILGPLTNPCGANCQLMGVYDGGLTETLTKVLKALGTKRALVVHGEDGLDEITLTTTTRISELTISGEIKTYSFNPEEAGLNKCSPQALSGGDVNENVRIAERILKGEHGPQRDIVLLNSAFGLRAAGKANDLKEGIKLASLSLNSGQAWEKLIKLKFITNA